MERNVGLSVLQIEVTNKCNLNCPHCYYYEEGEKGIEFNDFIEKKTVDQLFSDDTGIEYIRHLEVSGGEPLLAEDEIIYILHKIMENEILVFSFGLTTNGTILSERIACEMNIFAKKMYDILINHENDEVRKIGEESFKDNKIDVKVRISTYFHENNHPEKAYEFYKEHMPNVTVTLQNGAKDFLLDGGKHATTQISYSGRAKKLKCNFYCDSFHHKIYYDEEGLQVLCPLRMRYDGNISISAMCSMRSGKNNYIGNVFDGNTLREMITEWNYKTPLSCDEACELEHSKMEKELGRKYLLERDGETSMTDKELEEILIGTKKKMEFLEYYRLKLHKEAPVLTPEEIEDISLELFDNITKNESLNFMKVIDIDNKVDNKIAKLIEKHKFDHEDIKWVHDQFPYLTLDECKEWLKCYEELHKNKKKSFLQAINYTIKKENLEKLNKHRMLEEEQ